MAYSQEVRQRAAQLRQDGLSYAQIGERLGVHRVTIMRWLNPEFDAKRRQYDTSPKMKAYYAAYRKHHKESLRQYFRDYSAQHSVEKRERARDWYAKNKERAKANVRRWKKTLRGRICERNQVHRRRQRLKRGQGVSSEQIRQLWEKQNGHCAYCGKPMVLGGNPHSPDYCTIDHIVPLSRGGLHDISNIVLACRACNMKKSDRLPEELCLSKL